ncbi:hypothetical protein Tco_1536339, partial [Tanacetum coccineum]
RVEGVGISNRPIIGKDVYWEVRGSYLVKDIHGDVVGKDVRMCLMFVPGKEGL